MQDDKITATEISEWLAAEGKKAVWLAKTMGVTAATVSRWLSGKIIPSGSDESILKMLVRGDMPFDLIGTRHLHGILDFTTDQWRVIETMARREATTPGKWIANQIRHCLTYNDDAKSIQAEIVRDRFQSLPPKEENLEAKVADERK